MSVIKRIEFLIKDLSFWLIQVFLRKSDHTLLPVDLDKGGSLLFLRYDRLGDMIVSLPVFRAVKERYPELKIDLLCSASNVQIVKDDPNFNRLYIYQKNFVKDIILNLTIIKNCLLPSKMELLKD